MPLERYELQRQRLDQADWETVAQFSYLNIARLRLEEERRALPHRRHRIVMRVKNEIVNLMGELA